MNPGSPHPNSRLFGIMHGMTAYHLLFDMWNDQKHFVHGVHKILKAAVHEKTNPLKYNKAQVSHRATIRTILESPALLSALYRHPDRAAGFVAHAIDAGLADQAMVGILIESRWHDARQGVRMAPAVKHAFRMMIAAGENAKAYAYVREGREIKAVSSQSRQ